MLNALNLELAQTIADELSALDCDNAVDGIVLTGAGDRAFCAGVDLQEARVIKINQIEDWFGTV